MSKSKKKILLAISHSFCANFIRGQAGFLRKKGYEVYIASADGDEIRSVVNDEGANFVQIDFAREISPLKDFITLLKVINVLYKVRPDIVNAGNPKSGLLFMVACVFFPKTKAIFTLRGMRSDTLTGIKKRLVLFMEKLSCKLSEKTIVISPSLRDHAIKSGLLNDSKAIVIGYGSSNGINLDIFSPTAQNVLAASHFRAKLGIEESDFVIGFAGRITKDKGVTELYQSFKILKSKFANIKLVLTGPIESDDPIDPSVMTEINTDTSVYLTGKSANIASVLLSYDVLVLCSHREGFGNVALEAAAMMRAVVVSDIPGCKDTVHDGHSGFLVKVNDANDLATKLSNYILNRDLCKEHGQNGRNRVLRFFGSDIIWNGQLELYERLLKGGEYD